MHKWLLLESGGSGNESRKAARRRAAESVLRRRGMKFEVIDTKTGKYPDLWKIALEEYWAKGLMYCDMEGFAIEEDGTLILLDECGRHAYCPEGRFKIVWAKGETE